MVFGYSVACERCYSERESATKRVEDYIDKGLDRSRGAFVFKRVYELCRLRTTTGLEWCSSCVLNTKLRLLILRINGGYKLRGWWILGNVFTG